MKNQIKIIVLALFCFATNEVYTQCVEGLNAPECPGSNGICDLRTNDKAFNMLENSSNLTNFIVMGDPELSQSFFNIMDDIETKHIHSSGDYIKPGFMVIVGDLFPFCVGNEGTLEHYKYWHNYLTEWMTNTNIPVLILPGNHDMDCSDCLQYYTKYIGDTYWDFIYDQIAFVGINNVQQVGGYVGPGATNESQGYTISNDTYEAVDGFLSNPTSNYTKFFHFAHVPLMVGYRNCIYPNYNEYYSMLVEHGLTASLAGHSHKYDKEYLCELGVHDFVTGSAGPNLSGNWNENNYNQFFFTETPTNVKKFGADKLKEGEIDQDYSLQCEFELVVTYVGCDPDDDECGPCDIALYNEHFKPTINIIEQQDGACYACILALSGKYENLDISINGELMGDSDDIINGQACYKLDNDVCDARVEVEYISCASQEIEEDGSCAKDLIFHDPNDLQGMFEDRILTIDPCDKYVIMQGAAHVSYDVLSISQQDGDEIPVQTVEVEGNNKVKISWADAFDSLDDEFASTVKVTFTMTYCGCDYTGIFEIPIEFCDEDKDCCPIGSLFDGTDCYYGIDVPNGYDPFIWNNGLYTHPGPSGECPPGAEPSGSHCSYRISIVGGYNGYIDDNGSFYAEKDCDNYEAGDKCCPPGSYWDGSNCKFDFKTPDGYTAFLSDDGTFYVHPDQSGGCPDGIIPDALGCNLQESIPDPYDGFIYSNSFYAHEDCSLNKCCPPGSNWDGGDCKFKLEIEIENFDDYTPFISEDGTFYVHPDSDGKCPEGSIEDELGCNLQQGVHPEFEGYVQDNAFYADENCNIVNCCPEGSIWDKEDGYCLVENPLFGGGNGWIDEDGNVFLEPNYELEWCQPCYCSHTWNEAENRCETGVIAPPGFEGGIIVSGSIAIEADCEACCPEGFVFDGKHCVTVDKPYGRGNGWIDEEGNIFIETDDTFEWCDWKPCYCSHEWNEEKDRCETGEKAPLGFEGEVIDGNLVLDPNCDTCCPEGFEFDGKECVSRTDLTNVTTFSVDGRLALHRDCGKYTIGIDCCPSGFTRIGDDCVLITENTKGEIEISSTEIIVTREAERCRDQDKSFEKSAGYNENLSTPSNLRKESTKKTTDAPIEVNVFPVPSSGRVHISMQISTELLGKKIKMSIMDATGTLVKNVVLNGNSSKIPHEIDIEHPGVYFLKILDAQNELTVKKLIIL